MYTYDVGSFGIVQTINNLTLGVYRPKLCRKYTVWFQSTISIQHGPWYRVVKDPA